MSAPAIHRLALAAACAAVASALAAPPAAALPGPAPAAAAAVGEDRHQHEFVAASRVVAEPLPALADGGRTPLVAAGAGVVALMGAFVVGLSRRPEPVD